MTSLQDFIIKESGWAYDKCNGFAILKPEFLDHEDEWIHSMIYGARQEVKNNDMGELIVEHSLSDYNDPYPVIYNKRK